MGDLYHVDGIYLREIRFMTQIAPDDKNNLNKACEIIKEKLSKIGRCYGFVPNPAPKFRYVTSGDEVYASDFNELLDCAKEVLGEIKSLVSLIEEQNVPIPDEVYTLISEVENTFAERKVITLLNRWSSDSGRGTSKAVLWKLGEIPDEAYQDLRQGRPIEEVIEEYGLEGVEKVEIPGNKFLKEGCNYIWNVLAGYTPVTPVKYIGVGDGTDPEDFEDTGLKGANKLYKSADDGYPQVVDNKIVVRATFGPGEATFAWNEWTLATGPSDDDININRKVVSLGTKDSEVTWVFEVEVYLQ